MAQAFDRDALLDAFDRIGVAAADAKTRLQIAVYGGSTHCCGMISSENRKTTFRDHALMLASNFRFATEDVDIADIGGDWPDWLTQIVAEIARDKGWSEDWLNDAVSFHLSPLARTDRDHFAFGHFPRRTDDEYGLAVLMPSARYQLALKLKSLRVANFEKGPLDLADAGHLLKVVGVTEVEHAIDILAEFFPRSAADADKQRYVVKRLLAGDMQIDAPEYPRRSE